MIALDPSVESAEVQEFERSLHRLVVGQDRAVRQLSRVYQVHRAGLAAPNHPLANLLLLGPTGSGKTRLVEAAAEILFSTPGAVLKIDCAEYYHGHEIAKLIGSPPGYLGHRETEPMLSQENIERYHTIDNKLSFVLFDEIEKASPALWNLMLGILDKATMSLGDNRRVSFSRCVIFLTSNLGSGEVNRLVSGGFGFVPTNVEADALDQKIYRAASDAAKRKFSAEFMNRIDRTIVFRALRPEHLESILDLELEQVQERIMRTDAARQFVLKCDRDARDFILREGVDQKFGARHLKRAIERHLVFPVSSLLASGQIGLGDLVVVTCRGEKLVFEKEERGALVEAAKV